jgi:transmembrane 9 superfamily protein 2/4
MGCFVTAEGKKKDACVISDHYKNKNTFYLFNHVDITIMYHDGINGGYEGNRLVQARSQQNI